MFRGTDMSLMGGKVTKFYKDRRYAIIVRFLERRLNRNRRIVPGTLVERFATVQAQLLQGGRDLEIYNLMLMLEWNYYHPAKALSKLLGTPVGTIKQTRRRLRRVEEELQERGELLPWNGKM